ncbi:MAG: M48 family metallopeptidase [Clostridiales bacterium]|nr:M48 family metallopeptidase [Clostridiales bacterium]
MLRAIEYCGLRMEYEFTKKDIKNINIRITADGGISVSAPAGLSPKYVDSFVQDRAEWIFRKLADVEKRREGMPDDGFYDGKTLYYLGNEYTLRLAKGRKFEVKKTANEIIVSSRAGDDNLKPKYISWLNDEAKPVFEDSLTRMLDKAGKYNIERPEIYVRNMKSRWGSCSNTKKRIGLNVQLMKADVDCIDQVVAHELAHFVVFDHSAEFYQVLSDIMPDWKERKDRLEKMYKDGIM